VDRRNWHVTLVFIGLFPDHRMDELQLAIERVAVQPFRLRFDRLSFWPRPKIACLEALAVPEELKLLKTDLEQALLPLGIEAEAPEYRPHITVVRAARRFPTARLARPIELQWSGFELVESVSVPGGVRYRPLKQRVRPHS